MCCHSFPDQDTSENVARITTPQLSNLPASLQTEAPWPIMRVALVDLKQGNMLQEADPIVSYKAKSNME